MKATSWLIDVELRAEIRMMELIDSSDELSKVRDESRHSVEETRSGIGIELGLGIDLNEIPSPSFHETLHDLFKVIWNFHDNPPPLLRGPAKLTGAENDAGADNINHACCFSGACGACGGPEVKGQVVVYEGCEHASTSATSKWELVARFWATMSGFVWSASVAVWRARERKKDSKREREKCLEAEKMKENETPRETLRAKFLFIYLFMGKAMLNLDILFLG